MDRLSQPVAVPLWAVVATVVGIAVLLVVLWSVKHRRDVHYVLPEPAPLAEMLPSIAGLTHGALVEGNKVELLENGDGFFPRLFADLGAAEDTIHFEVFLWEEGELARRTARALAERAEAGVEVRLLVDASGGRGLSGQTLRTIQEAGVEVARYHPLGLKSLGNLNNRDHRKIVVVDGRLGYVGGHCIVDTWLGDAEDREHFRDVSARVEGPVVQQLQSAFTENWVEQTGEVVAGPRYFPELEAVGESRAHLAYVSPSGSPSSVELLYYLAIRAAREQILIQNPYFLPDPDGLELLRQAAARGVTVRIMLPSAEATDSALVQHASHHHFGNLLKAGIEIYEYDRTLLHQKVMTVDHLWSAVGSTNFDDRSFELNDEASLGIESAEIARALEEAFAADLRHCRRRTLDEWRGRPLWHKLIDGTAYLINEQL